MMIKASVAALLVAGTAIASSAATVVVISHTSEATCPPRTSWPRTTAPNIPTDNGQRF